MAIPNLALRFISAIVLLPPILLLIVFAPTIAFSGACVVFAAIAGFEFGTITLPADLRLRRFVLSLFSSVICAAIVSEPFWDHGQQALLFSLVLVFPLTSLFFMFTKTDLSKAAPAFGLSTAGILYAGGLWGVVGLIHSSDQKDGWKWVLLLLVSTVLTDTFAYAFGRLFGKTKLAPRISPGKTWAGTLGGTLGSIAALAAAKLTLLPSIEWIEVVLLGFPLGAICQIGDLAESFLKRGFGVKDSGKIIPGHGGFLDRVDALMFAAPVIYVFLQWK